MKPDGTKEFINLMVRKPKPAQAVSGTLGSTRESELIESGGREILARSRWDFSSYFLCVKLPYSMCVNESVAIFSNSGVAERAVREERVRET